MSGIVGIISFVIILLIVITFTFFYAVNFIKPTTIQIQLFGIHLTIFGGFVFLNNLLTGFLIMMLGLTVGIFGSFKDSDSFIQNEG